MRRVHRQAVAAAFIAAFAAPAALSAQVCIGVPIRDGAFGIIGEFQTTDGGQAFGGNVTANLTGPLTLQGGYRLVTLDDIDENANEFFANVAYEVPNLSFSVCPVVGVSFTKWSEEEFGFEVDITQTVIPIGLGIGSEFEVGPNLNMSLFAIPQFLHMRAKVSVSDGTNSESETESNNEFGGMLGVRIGTSQFFGGAGVSFTTIEESDPVFSIGIGIAIGGSR